MHGHGGTSEAPPRTSLFQNLPGHQRDEGVHACCFAAGRPRTLLVVGAATNRGCCSPATADPTNRGCCSPLGRSVGRSVGRLSSAQAKGRFSRAPEPMSSRSSSRLWARNQSAAILYDYGVWRPLTDRSIRRIIECDTDGKGGCMYSATSSGTERPPVIWRTQLHCSGRLGRTASSLFFWTPTVIGMEPCLED